MTTPIPARVFPNDRLSYRYDATRDRVASAAGAKVTFFEDQGATVPATLRLYPSGDLVAGGVVTVGPDSLIPEFWEASGRDLMTLWALPEGGTLTYRTDSRLSDRVAAVETSVVTSGRGYFRYDQLAAASTWSVTHNLPRLPSVTVILDGAEVDTDITYPSASQVVAVFPVPVAGTLICT